MKKVKKFLKILISALILGFLMSFLKHNGYWFKLMNGFKAINIFLYLLFIILFVFLNILIHELGHLFSFVFSKIRIRAIFVLIFSYFKTENNKKHFKIYFKNIKMFGGFVVPSLPDFENDQQYNKVTKKFRIALLMGPITSILFFIITITIFLLQLFIFNNPFLLGLFAILAIITLLMTIIIMISSTFHTEELYGDFVAYKKMKEDERFALVQMTQYTNFALDENKNANIYLFNKIEQYFLKNEPSYNTFDTALISYYINIYLFNDNLTLNEQLFSNYNIRTLAARNSRELAYLISAYYYKINNPEKAFEYFHLVNLTYNSYLDPFQKELLQKQYEHLLNVVDNTKYFEANEESILNQLGLLRPIFLPEEVLSAFYQQLPFVNYSCQLNFEEE